MYVRECVRAHTRVPGARLAGAVAASDFIAGYHPHIVGAVTCQVREGTHGCCVVAYDGLVTVHGPRLVQLCPAHRAPPDLQGLCAHQADEHVLWATRHCGTEEIEHMMK